MAKPAKQAQRSLRQEAAMRGQELSSQLNVLQQKVGEMEFTLDWLTELVMAFAEPQQLPHDKKSPSNPDLKNLHQHG